MNKQQLVANIGESANQMNAKMKTSECVLLKRKGAEHVQAMLRNKSKEEELKFWQKRTENLHILHNKALRRTSC